jgi:hypothetical protein
MTTWEAWHLRFNEPYALVSEWSSYLTCPWMATIPSRKARWKLIVAGKARQFMADCKNGKQKRTKTRKEKAEETKNLTAKTVPGSRPTSPENPPAI